MDREALARWLHTPRKTWRWNRGETHGYEGLELREGSLIWFRWRADDPRGEGRSDELPQSAASFVREGPLRQLPKPVYEEVLAFLREHSLEGEG